MTSDARSASWHAAAHPGPAALRGNLGVALAQARDAPGPSGAWRRGWALTGMGLFGQAWRDLAACGPALQPYGAAAGLTRAALLRQIGMHVRAVDEDTAVTAAAPAGSEIAASARIGLVADAVALQADSDEIDGLLAAAGRAVGATASPRQRIRIAWVAGDVAMAAGEHGLAEGRFAAAADAAQMMGARRHQAASLSRRAAALHALGQRDVAAAMAVTVLDLAAACDARPLVQSAHQLLAELEPGGDHASLAARLRAEMIDGLPGDVLGAGPLAAHRA